MLHAFLYGAARMPGLSYPMANNVLSLLGLVVLATVAIGRRLGRSRARR